MKRIVMRSAVAAAVLLVAGGMTATAAVADPSEPPADFSGTYPVTGTGHLKKAGATVPLGPTKLAVDIYSVPDSVDLGFTATLPLPPKTLSFKAFGYLPVKAKLYFTQVGVIPGRAVYDETDGSFRVQGRASYVLSLRDVVVGGAAARVGDNCQTRYPVEADVASTKGFNLLDGGTLQSTFDIGRFDNCATSTGLVNLIVPGSGNTLTAKLGKLTLDDPADVRRLGSRSIG